MAGSENFVAGFTTCPYKFLELGEKARARGFKKINCTMPFPVHGFEEAYGFKHSWIGLAALAGLFCGWIGGFLMQAWMMSVDYPLNVGGRPHINWPAFIPVTFECGILVSGITTLLCLLGANKLAPNPSTTTLRDRCTDDLFSIIIPIGDGNSEEQAKAFLKEEEIEDMETFNSKILEPLHCQCGSPS